MSSYETPRDELVAEIARLQRIRDQQTDTLITLSNERDRLKARVRVLEEQAMDQDGELYRDRFHRQMQAAKGLLDRIEQLENEAVGVHHVRCAVCGCCEHDHRGWRHPWTPK